MHVHNHNREEQNRSKQHTVHCPDDIKLVSGVWLWTTSSSGRFTHTHNIDFSPLATVVNYFPLLIIYTPLMCHIYAYTYLLSLITAFWYQDQIFLFLLQSGKKKDFSISTNTGWDVFFVLIRQLAKVWNVC